MCIRDSSYIKEQTDDEKEQKAFLQKLYSQVSVMDSGARGSTTTFVENQKGDVPVSYTHLKMYRRAQVFYLL